MNVGLCIRHISALRPHRRRSLAVCRSLTCRRATGDDERCIADDQEVSDPDRGRLIRRRRCDADVKGLLTLEAVVTQSETAGPRGSNSNTGVWPSTHRLDAEDRPKAKAMRVPTDRSTDALPRPDGTRGWEASGRRAVIASIPEDRHPLRRVVKWANLMNPGDQIFRLRPMQLDIFDDSRDVMLRNDVLSALQRHDALAARPALQILKREYPDDEALVALDTLVTALEERCGTSFANHDTALGERETVLARLRPAAIRVMGERTALMWLAPFWDELAQRAASLSFRAAQPNAHAAPLYLQAGNWKAAESAVTRIESWRRIPAPLMWMAECRYRLDGLEAALPLLAELAWLSPSRFDDLLRQLEDNSLNALRRAFDASFEGTGDITDLAWFPAWALIQKTGLAPLLKQTDPSRDTGPERAARLVLRLLMLEREGRHHELMDSRRDLRDLHEALYRQYMKTR
ncbi:hypothetical protein [Paraburkholderia sp. BL23I1N1]|uniref:hypothetical protein n=1 Tax=Paraburkholderia sp. BL23I1N1 TaxID=1938802 RepID=UPI00217D0154|nr:hypothetical protein [Paraburkholderia sp. BL23I1N1]